MFSSFGNVNSTITTLNLTDWNLNSITGTNSYRLFYDAKNLTVINTTSWNLGTNTTKLALGDSSDGSYGWFNGCKSLTQIVGIENWQGTPRISSAVGTFRDCGTTSPGMTSLDLSAWDRSNCVNTSYMFYGFGNNTNLDASNLVKTANTNMSYMFYNIHVGTFNISGYNTQNVANMQNIFYYAFNTNSSAIPALDLSSWNTNALTNLYQAFYSCKTTAINISSWTTPVISDLRETFRYTANGGNNYIDMRNANFARVTNATYFSNMFTNINASLIVYVKDATQQAYIIARSGLPAGQVQIMP
jgi:hypothetical protein